MEKLESRKLSIIQENFPEMKDMSSKIVPSTIAENQWTQRHLIMQFQDFRDKEKIVKASAIRN